MNFTTSNNLLDGLERHLTRVEGYLRRRNIAIPSNFRAEAKKNILVAKGYYIPLSEKDIENAIFIADYWRAALKNSDEYEKLVIQILYSLYRIQACSINNNVDCEKLYLGSFCKVNTESELAIGGKKIRATCVSVGSDHVTKIW